MTVLKNRIARKLMCYFTGCLIIFSLLVCGVFYVFFTNHTIDVKKQAVKSQAFQIAQALSNNLERIEGNNPNGIATSRYISYLDDVTQEIIWVIDKNGNLSINEKRMKSYAERYKHQHGMHKGRKMLVPTFDPKEAYKNLTPELLEKVNECWRGENFSIEADNPAFEDKRLVVGVPVHAKNGEIKAVLLLHAPVSGLSAGTSAVVKIMLGSMIFALFVAMGVSVYLSKRFTDPLNKMRDNAMRLAEKEYAVRNNFVIDNEIGDLGCTLDELAVRLKDADDEHERMEEMRRDFIANVSHELRTPVTVIRGNLEMLRDGVIDDVEGIHECHEQMYKDTLFLQRLINDLLELTRLQKPDFAIEDMPLNFCDVVRDAYRRAKRLAREKELDVQIAMDEDVYPMMGDYGRLQQMLMVFITNSIKFSKAQGKIELTLSGREFSVRDYGCGIAASEIDKVFEQYKKTRNEQNKEGTGLGLAIAREIARRHGMSVKVASVEGEWTQFTVELPEAMSIENMEG